MSGTSTTSFTASAIVPNQSTWGNYQRFTFPATDPLAKLQAFSEFVPTTVNNSVIALESRNFNYAGFRWHHLTKSTDTNSFGSFTFQSFVSDGVGTDIFGFDGTNFNIYYPPNMQGNKILNVAPGSASSDGANIFNITNAISSTTVTLTGNVTGSAALGGSIATTIASTLDQIPLAGSSVNINSQKLINVASGSASTDGANIGNITSALSSSTITLTGNVTGSGTLGTPFATTIVTTLNNIPIATGSININSQIMNSVGSLGIGVASALYPLQFASSVSQCKICLYSGAANNFQIYGFGVNAGILKYTVDQSTSNHVFYCGASSTTSTELFRIAGTGYATVSSGTGTFYSRVPSAHVHMYSNSTNTTNTGVWVKLNGTTTSSGAVQCTTSSNRITFTGSDLSAACTGMVSCSATLSVSATSSILIGIYKNGTTLLEAPVSSTANMTSGVGFSVTVPEIMVSLSPGDYVEVWALSSISTGTITTQHLNLAFRAC